MRYLITGGAGFIGSHLSDLLLREGHEVFVIDDLSTGAMDNIRHLKDHAAFHYVIDTIANGPLLAELVDSVDAVFHLAAAVGVKLVVEQPVRTIETNIDGTSRVLSAAQKKQKPVLVASSSEVYGKATSLPFREDDDMVLALEQGALELRMLQGHRRVPRPRLRPGAGAADGGGASFQHRRAAPDRPLRHGGAVLRAAGRPWGAHHGVR